MAQYQARIAPFINEEFTVTGAQPYYDDGTIHGGFDISTGTNSPLYSMTAGIVIYSQYNTGGYGNMIIIRDPLDGTSILYAHLRDLPLYSVGQSVPLLAQIGVEGNTGDSTGIHTHLEIQYNTTGFGWDWNIPKLTRPHVADFMGIPNTYGITAIFNGTPPTPPTPTGTKHKFKWVLYANKIRNRNVNNYVNFT
ncbi:M23 family metallopeptidase [bacterium]|nr:M23 family metallopeptidase [bacterium]